MGWRGPQSLTVVHMRNGQSVARRKSRWRNTKESEMTAILLTWSRIRRMGGWLDGRTDRWMDS